VIPKELLTVFPPAVAVGLMPSSSCRSPSVRAVLDEKK
jgi:hypothetical protein